MAKKQWRVKVSFNSPVILGFTGICLLSLILGWLTNGASTVALFSVYRSPLSLLTLLRFFGHVFGHASLEHFMGNIMLILVVGPLLEEKYGSKTLAQVIVITALTTGLVHFIFFPGVMLLGASGVVFSLILLSSFTSIKEGSIPLTFILVAVIYIGEQVYDGLFIQDNVSNLTHIIGGLVGSWCGYNLNVKHSY
jgi:GlpG protein